MSSRGRGADGYTPDPNGFFETQPQVTRAALTFLNIKPGMTILQPGCGTGAIAKVLRREFGKEITIVGVEIDRSRAKKAKRATVVHQKQAATERGIKHHVSIPVFDEVHVADFLTFEFATKFDLAIENPSFKIWLPFTEKCFTVAEQSCMLIPWNSAASKGRVDWWLQHPAYARVLSPRPSFAQSVKCVYTNAKRAKADDAKVCSFQELISLSETAKDECPLCGADTSTIRSDSNEYCWAHWSPDITHNRWDPCKTPPPHPDDE